MPPQQLRSVSSIGRRIAFSVGKFFRKGPAGWLAAERYLQVASELAFWRDRQQRGFASDAGEEAELVTQLQTLQAQLL